MTRQENQHEGRMAVPRARNNSAARSIDSITPSQLNKTFIDIFNTQPVSQAEQSLRGNPVTVLGKRLQLLRLVGTVMIPILALVSMVGHIFGTCIEAHILSQDVRLKIRYSLELSQIMHTLQKERDVSMLYISSTEFETKENLVRSYRKTDMVLDNLSKWPHVGNQGGEEFHSKDSFVRFLNHHRYTLDMEVPTITKELNFYSNLMHKFIQWFNTAFMEANSGTVWKDLVAMQEIVEAREAFGIERALGSIFFTTGSFKNMHDYLRFANSQDIANMTLNSAREYSPLVDIIYNKTISHIDRQDNGIYLMRHIVRNKVLSLVTPSLENIASWYGNMTIYLDMLLFMQSDLSKLILQQLSNKEQNDAETIITVAILFTSVLFMCPLVLNAVYSVTSNIQSFSLYLANQTRALDNEKKRTDLLLYQMLPRPVADLLRKNVEINAETFSDVTVFFSDIVGFTAICAKSSPIQVVNMLNVLYTCFDHQLEQHDVYKVETIGDAYMVASGLPKPNGRRHAVEIAALALELLDIISNLEIPHMPRANFRIRIGCHTGQVVAGIVGVKMPRYCLFGETVIIASRMECTGKVGRIHISESTHDVLNELGGYVMHERTGVKTDITSGLAPPEMAQPVSDNKLTKFQALMGHLRSMKTYWLVHKEGKKRIGITFMDSGMMDISFINDDALPDERKKKESHSTISHHGIHKMAATETALNPDQSALYN